jgi:putative DNA primase/helicase
MIDDPKGEPLSGFAKQLQDANDANDAKKEPQLRVVPRRAEDVRERLERIEREAAAKRRAKRAEEARAKAGSFVPGVQPGVEEPGDQEPEDAGLIDGADWLGTAERFVQTRYSWDGVRTLHWWNEEWWAWDGTRYRVVEDGAVRKKVYDFLNTAEIEMRLRGGKTKYEAVQPSRSMVNNLVDALKSVVFLDREVTMPGWFGDAPLEDLAQLTAMENGLLYLPTRQLLAHTPRFWNPTVLEFRYDPRAVALRTQQFLREVWPTDVGARAALMELFGLCLTTVTLCHKAFIFVGPTRGGRGTIGRVLKGLVGREAYVGASFDDLKERFGMELWIGKRVVVYGDAKLEGASKAKLTTISERIQTVTGEDDVAVDQKNKKAVSNALSVRILIFSNEPIRFLDDSGALATRFVTWQMTRNFEAEGLMDRNLTAKLLAERPGILNMALDGLDRLRRREWEFPQPKSGEDLLQQMKELASLIRVFVEECCVLGNEREELVEMLYDRWEVWIRDRGGFPGIAEDFSKKLRAMYALGSHRPREFRGKRRPTRPTVLLGIGLRSKDDD